MKYVLDSSVAAKWVLPESGSVEALALRDDLRSKIHECIAPDILPIEVGHAISRAERQGRVSKADGFSLWMDVMADCPQLIPYLPLMPCAYALSSQARIGVYDCIYVAVGEHEQCNVISADQRLVNTFPGQVISLASFES